MKKLYINAIKYREKGMKNDVIRFIFFVVSFVYLFFVKLNFWFYSFRIRKRCKANIPVISVGNLSVGGTGKTPLVIYLAEKLKKMGAFPAIVTRGYGKDENILLEQHLGDVPVIVNKNRYEASKHAEKTGAGIVVLDDGFQHIRLYRDLDILLIDANHPPFLDSIFPGGTLREPVAGINRADIVILTKTENVYKEKLEQINEYMKNKFKDKPVFTSKYKPVYFSDLDGKKYTLESMKDKKCVIVSAIGDPNHFIETVKFVGLDIKRELIYPDHHAFNECDIKKIIETLINENADNIIITAKDAVKFTSFSEDLILLSTRILNIEIAIDQKEMFFVRLNSVISGKTFK